jgi:hypothetical protein
MFTKAGHRNFFIFLDDCEIEHKNDVHFHVSSVDRGEAFKLYCCGCEGGFNEFLYGMKNLWQIHLTGLPESVDTVLMTSESIARP